MQEYQNTITKFFSKIFILIKEFYTNFNTYKWFWIYLWHVSYIYIIINASNTELIYHLSFIKVDGRIYSIYTTMRNTLLKCCLPRLQLLLLFNKCVDKQNIYLDSVIINITIYDINIMLQEYVICNVIKVQYVL